jgi:hypothetical protein
MAAGRQQRLRNGNFSTLDRSENQPQVGGIMKGFDVGRLGRFCYRGDTDEAMQNMPLRVGCRCRPAIDSKYREAATVPRVYSENDPRSGRVAWSNVREVPEGVGKRPSLKVERPCGGNELAHGNQTGN